MVSKTKIAYFSMEIGINSRMPTYSGGLGVLAGDTIQSCADLNVPMVAVTLLYKHGYFYQKLTEKGRQTEESYQWDPHEFLTLLEEKVKVKIEGRDVCLQAWRYEVKGSDGSVVPILLLDADLDENSEYARSLSHSLYGGDEKYRLAQEVVLGIGGIKMLKKLGYSNIRRFHMNEGHSSLLTLELLKEKSKNAEGTDWDVEGVRSMCVFTTHTPVPAGHDKFSYDLVKEVLEDYFPYDSLKEFAGTENLNMTHLALNLSHYINGVAKKHGEISREMFPGYHIDSITNGIHSDTWTNDYFKKLYNEYIPGWEKDPFALRYALNIPREDIWKAHCESKNELVEYINTKTGIGMNPDILTIGFARRATAYKRAALVFSDLKRLEKIAKKSGGLQFVFSGKAHPKDEGGKELIQKIVAKADDLKENIKIVYLENYEIDLAKMITTGVDVWLNTPRKPQEASGTSGMKAAHNGIPSLSILDGWWIEGCLEGLTGWSIGSSSDSESSDEQDASFLYDKLENAVVPLFYQDRKKWIDVMRHTIAINASFFNTHRMVRHYVINAYL